MKFSMVILPFILGHQVHAAALPAPTLYESVLFIGDDYVAGGFGRAVDEYLRTIAVEVNTIAECGSMPSNWIGTNVNFESTRCGYWQKNEKGEEKLTQTFKARSFFEELAKADPDLTVISLGTNALKSAAVLLNEQSAVERILHEVVKTRSKCIWIGPPNLTRKPFVTNLPDGVKLLKKWVTQQGCDYIDSTKFSQYRGKGGFYYTEDAGKKWGLAVAIEIAKLSRPSLKEEQELNINPGVQGGSTIDRAPR